MAERTVGPRGKVVSVYMSFEAIDLLDKAATAFNVSRSDVLDNLVVANREALEAAVADKTNRAIRA